MRTSKHGISIVLELVSKEHQKKDAFLAAVYLGGNRLTLSEQPPAQHCSLVPMEIHEELVIVANGTYLIFRFMCDKNDCSVLVFISQKVPQTANVPVVTKTPLISSNSLYLFGLSFIFSFTSSCSSWSSRPSWSSRMVHPAACTPYPGPLHGPPVPARPTGRHAHAELNFYTTQLHSACTSSESSSSPSLSCSASRPLPPYTGRRGCYRPRGRRGGRGGRGGRGPWNHCKFKSLTNHCNN